MGMGQRGERTRLANEPMAGFDLLLLREGSARPHSLECDPAVQSFIERLVDRAHSAVPQCDFDAVSAGMRSCSHAGNTTRWRLRPEGSVAWHDDTTTTDRHVSAAARFRPPGACA